MTNFKIQVCGFLAVIWVLLTAAPFSVVADDIIVGGENFEVPSEVPDLLGDDEFDDEFGDDFSYESEYAPVSDPLEPMNRVFFEFNDKMYFWVLKPVKTGYRKVVPSDFRLVLGNFFFNLRAPVRLVNNLLQGQFKDAGIVLSRFAINSTIGVFGFGDIAADAFDLQPKQADFGQTLGVYGIGSGVYICWPFLGPSNVRDSFGQATDFFIDPLIFADIDTTVTVGAYSLDFVNRLTITPDVYEEMKKISLDPYVATREAYIDYRRNIIENYDK